MDRNDLQLRLFPVPHNKLVRRSKGESSSAVAERVRQARAIQAERFSAEGIFTNAEMGNRQIEKYCPLDAECSKTMESLMDRLTYRNFEIIAIENNSKAQDTFDYYNELLAKYGEGKNPSVKVVYYEGGFNFSAINNFGAEAASGEYLLLLNNDTEVLAADLLEELLMFGQDPEVAAVGARLFYPDGDLQHAGIVMGLGGVAGHVHQRKHGDDTGYFNRVIAQQDISGVTAACMLVKRSAFDEVGGLNEDLAVAFNDVDFCLKLREAGYRIVYNPYATMTHYESKSRGYEDNPEKVSRFVGEITYMKNRWKDVLWHDPYYNINLTHADVNCELAGEE